MLRELKTYVHTKVCTQMFRATLFLAVRRTQMSNNWSMEKQNMVYISMQWNTMQPRRGMKFRHVTTWRNFENITLSGKSQSQRVSCCVILFIWNVQKRQVQKIGDRWVRPEAKGWNRKWLLMGMWSSFGVLKMFRN